MITVLGLPSPSCHIYNPLTIAVAFRRPGAFDRVWQHPIKVDQTFAQPSPCRPDGSRERERGGSTMKDPMRILQGLKLAAVLAVALSIGACAKNPLADGAMASAATPGSQQDFVVNVGDRVFFDSDQTELSPQAIATLERKSTRL